MTADLTTHHEFKEICQSGLPILPWLDQRTNRLPGVNPLDWQDWLIRDDAFARQMAYRDHLLLNQRDAVFSCLPEAGDAATELLDKIVTHVLLDDGYQRNGNRIERPDGVVVDLDVDHPLVSAGRLTQEDHCILMEQEDGHILKGAVLCFPASWMLSEKVNRNMLGIHIPVQAYSDDLNIRVLRMFDRIQPDRPLWRANNLIYSDPDLHQPRRASNRRKLTDGEKWVRVERQSLIRLPETQALCFGIHTYVVPFNSVDRAAATGLEELLIRTKERLTQGKSIS